MAMSYRRPTSLPYGPWVEDCVRVLDSDLAPGGHLNDRRIIEMVRLQRIVEETIPAVFTDSQSPPDFSDARTRFIFKTCLARVERWRHTTQEDIINCKLVSLMNMKWQHRLIAVAATLAMHYQTILIMLHEPALYNAYDISDFRPPYALSPSPLSRQHQAGIGFHTASSHMSCILSAKALIRMFLDLPAETLLFIPVVTYTRVAYAVVVLIKSLISLRAYTQPADVQLEEPLDPVSAISQLLGKLETARDQAHGRVPVPAVFHSILSAVYKWYIRIFTQDTCCDADEILAPMMHLSLGEDEQLDFAESRDFSTDAGRLTGEENDSLCAEGHFGWEELDLMELKWQDTSMRELLMEPPDFFDQVDHLFV